MEMHYLIQLFIYISSVLSEDATQTQSFEVLATSLHHYFSKHDYFKVGTALVSIIEMYSYNFEFYK